MQSMRTTRDFAFGGGRFAADTDVTFRVRFVSDDGATTWTEVSTVLQTDSSGSFNELIVLTSSIPSKGLALIEAFGTGREVSQHILSATLAVQPSATTDSDGDGDPDLCDSCPQTFNPDQADTDGDGLGDACDLFPQDYDNDLDGDGISAATDICPFDALNDADDDGLCASSDNCPDDSNADQDDLDLDGHGDVCDAFPADPDENTDTDSDGTGNNADPDDDNDGLQDDLDAKPLMYSNLCVGADADLAGVVSDYQQCGAPNSVTIKGTAGVTASGNLEVHSPRVTIESGFNVELNGEFKVYSGDPCAACPP